MLPKMWKKVLLAVCMIACIYNVMHKLVSRTSLEAQLKSVQNQDSIIHIVENTNRTTQDSSAIQDAANSNEVQTNTNKDRIVVVY